MKIGQGIISFLLFIVTCYGEDGIEPYTKEFLHAVDKGAPARITLRVHDADGNIVGGATVRTSFGKRWNDWEYTTTDTNGEVLITGVSGGQLNYQTEKTGYYETKGQYEFLGGKDGFALKDGMWQPWDSILDIVMKQKKNPIPMYAVYDEIIIPEQDKKLGYDFEKNDWVKPYGKGEVADVHIIHHYESENVWTFSFTLKILFDVNDNDGVISQTYDEFSTLKTQYAVPVDGHIKEIVWQRAETETNIIKKNMPTEKEYFMFRTRTETNVNGSIIKAKYGKIIQPIRYNYIDGKGLITWIYYFNPIVNSRNIEFDPKQNLAPYQVPMP